MSPSVRLAHPERPLPTHGLFLVITRKSHNSAHPHFPGLSVRTPGQTLDWYMCVRTHMQWVHAYPHLHLSPAFRTGTPLHHIILWSRKRDFPGIFSCGQIKENGRKKFGKLILQKILQIQIKQAKLSSLQRGRRFPGKLILQGITN